MKDMKKGFTIVELLVVIVVLIILSGVVFSVINPAKQQERARRTAVRATVEKACIALHACVAYASADSECDTWTEIGSTTLPSTPNGSFGNGAYSITYGGGIVTVSGSYVKADGAIVCSFTCTGDPSSGSVTNITQSEEGNCTEG